MQYPIVPAKNQPASKYWNPMQNQTLNQQTWNRGDRIQDVGWGG